MSIFQDIWFNNQNSEGDASQPLLDEPTPTEISKDITHVNLTVLSIQKLTNELFPKSSIKLILSDEEVNQKRRELATKRIFVNNKLKVIMEWLQNSEVRKKYREGNKKELQMYKKIVKKFVEEKEYLKFKNVLNGSIEREKNYLTMKEKEARSPMTNKTATDEEEGEEYFESTNQKSKAMDEKTFNLRTKAGTTYGEILDEELQDIQEFAKEMDDLEDIYMKFKENLNQASDIIDEIQSGKLDKIQENTKHARKDVKKAKEVSNSNNWMIIAFIVVILLIFFLICFSVFLIFVDFSVLFPQALKKKTT